MTHFLNLISRDMNLTLLTSLILHITSFGRPETACLGHACPRTSFLLPLEYCKWAAHRTAAFQEDRHKSERTVTYRGAGRLCPGGHGTLSHPRCVCPTPMTLIHASAVLAQPTVPNPQWLWTAGCPWACSSAIMLCQVLDAEWTASLQPLKRL